MTIHHAWQICSVKKETIRPVSGISHRNPWQLNNIWKIQCFCIHSHIYPECGFGMSELRVKSRRDVETIPILLLLFVYFVSTRGIIQ